MSDMREEGAGHRGLAALFDGDPQKPLRNHPNELLSDFPPFRAATNNMEHWPSLLSNSDQGTAQVVLMTHVSLVTVYNLADPTTRHAVAFDDLIESAQKDRGAFLALRQLAIADLRRSGTPNADLREWVASYLDDKFSPPSKKKGTRPHMATRGIFLATLIAHAERNGINPTRNKAAKGEPEPSACEIVASALKKAGWRDVPSVPSLEKIWQHYNGFVARSVEQPAKRDLSEFGVHPESLLAMMARYPSEKFV